MVLYDNIDEQLQKLEAICQEAMDEYLLYFNEIEIKTKARLEITQELLDKLQKADEVQQKAIYNLHTLQRLCAINRVDLTTYWVRKGFTEAQIQKFSEEL